VTSRGQSSVLCQLRVVEPCPVASAVSVLRAFHLLGTVFQHLESSYGRRFVSDAFFDRFVLKMRQTVIHRKDFVSHWNHIRCALSSRAAHLHVEILNDT